MSDEQGNAGWWLASDGRWYSPEQHPDFVAPPATAESPAAAPDTPPPNPASSQGTGWSKAWPWFAVSAAGFLMLSALIGLAAGPSDATDDVRIEEAANHGQDGDD